MNNVMAFDVVELDLPDFDTMKVYADIKNTWLERPFYRSKKSWVIDQMTRMYRGITIKDIDKYGATILYDDNEYIISFLDDSVEFKGCEKKSYGLVIPLEDYPFVIYIKYGKIEMEAFDGMEITRSFRHSLVYNELDVNRVCHTCIYPSLYDHLAGRKSIIDACIEDNHSHTLNLILFAFTMLGAEFPGKYSNGVADDGLLSHGFVEVTDG